MGDGAGVLPLGSVVSVRRGDGARLVVVGRGVVTEMEGVRGFFEYATVPVPVGLSDPKDVMMFNRVDVGEVVFVGYRDADEQVFEEHFDQLLADSGLPRLKVPESAKA